MFDFLIVGSGLFGSVCAHELNKKGKKVLVIEKRSHAGGNIYTENNEGIEVHKYGAHIFHTDSKQTWDYVNTFTSFEEYIHSPKANFKGELYDLPFNMYTFEKMWGVKNPEQARSIIENQKQNANISVPENLEQQAISLCGKDIYEKLIKGYTQKQWGKDCKELPPSIIKRIPVRFEYNNNYFNSKYQGIPKNGYTELIQKLLKEIEIHLNEPFEKGKYDADKIIYTGAIDEYFDYCYGTLEYRSLRFEEEILEQENFQNYPVVNYTDSETPFTRIIEHKHFSKNTIIQKKTIITKEFPQNWTKGKEIYYPINDEKNNQLYSKYLKLSEKEKNIIFGGRLGMYAYFDMDKTVEEALLLVSKLK